MINFIIIYLILICFYLNSYCSWDFEKVESLFPFGTNGCINNLSFTLVCSFPNRFFHKLNLLELNGEKVADIYYFLFLMYICNIINSSYILFVFIIFNLVSYFIMKI